MKQKFAVLAVLLAVVLLTGSCGILDGAANLLPSNTSTVQVTVGDAPGDSVVSFSVTLDSIVLTNTDGGTVSVLPESTRVELTHLAGTTTPIATVDIPQGTYTKVAITVSAPQVTVIRPITGDSLSRDLSTTVTRVISLSPALELGGTAVNLNLDLSVADSVSVDSGGNVTFNPRFLVHHRRLNAASLLLPILDPFVGRVDAISGNAFAVTVRFGRATVRINTSNQTNFVGISGVSDLTVGNIVSLFVRLGEDGRLFATRVVSMPPPAALGVQGLVKSTTGSPVNQFTLITHDGVGGLLPWLAGRMITVNLGGSTVYRIDSDDLDLSALPFTATFNAGNLAPAQALRVHAPAPAVAPTADSTSISLTASHVTLQPQPVAGQIANFSGGNTFTLALPTESAMARLMQSSTVQVFMQSGKTRLSGTVTDGSVTLANGQRAIVRGLLFHDGGQYKLAATNVVVEQ